MSQWRDWFVSIGLILVSSSAVQADGFELHKGDHICIIGNTLAERMQHAGWLETLIHSRFPQHEIVIRNLGYSGDEVSGYTDSPDRNRRLRSMDFGKGDEWLAGISPIPQPDKLNPNAPVTTNRFDKTNTKADVIFAFFGYNESHAGEAGLEKFKQDLANFITHATSQKYNGRTPPKIVVFSPIAHQDLHNRNLPDGAENNERLRLYTNAMYEVAKSHQVTFIDLFNPTLSLFGNTKQPLTINGVHLNQDGDREVAAIIDRSLFAPTVESKHDWESLEMLRTAVLDKNFHWYHRYRTTDGYSSYGDRAFLRFVDGQTNYEAVQRELEVLDVMTTNRDRRIWAITQSPGQFANSPRTRPAVLPPVDDSNTPPFIPVPTNKPGPGPNGSHVFLGGEEEISKMRPGKGLKVNLFASEEMFPELVEPVQMAFDTRGRLWVGAWPNYPHWKPKSEMNDKLLIFEDSDQDGRADKCKTFAGNLHNPTGFDFWGGGVLVGVAPDLIFLKDTDGDDVADVRERLLHGLDTADTHHAANSFVVDPGGAIYFQEGTFHHTQVESPYGPPRRNANAGVYRYEPRTQRLDVYVTFGFANPHGHVFDRWGNDIVHDGTGAVPYDAALFSGRLDFPTKHQKPPQVYQQRTRPCSGTEILTSGHFPDDFQGNLLVGNVIGFSGILRYKIEEKGGSFAGTELEPLVFSSDENFRPSDIETGPDGAVYFTDWHNPIIGHMQHNLRDPNRDKTHGRIYRVTYEGRPLLASPQVAGATVEKLLDLLKHPEDRVRYRARSELSGRSTAEVMGALSPWLARLDKKDPDFEHHRLEGLWLHQSHNVVNDSLLRDVLRSPDHRARSAATRVLCYWRDRLPVSSSTDSVVSVATESKSKLPAGYLPASQAEFSLAAAMDLLRVQADDEHPRVRLEAVRACSFFQNENAPEVALISLKHPTDEYLIFVLNETMRQLEPYWKSAISQDATFAADNPAGLEYLLSRVSTSDLLKFPRTRTLYQAMLSRTDIVPEFRLEALAGLADLNKSDTLVELLAAIERLDQSSQSGADQALNELAHLLFSGSGSGHEQHDHGPHGKMPSLSDRSKDAAFRSRLAKLSAHSKRPFSRQIAYVAMMTADGSLDPTWRQAEGNTSSLWDLLDAVPVIPDPKLRAAAHDRIRPLLDAGPTPPTDPERNSAIASGRYVRIELPRRGTLTLAEVQVFSDGANIAPRGTAKQSSTAHGADANRAIDGNTSGVFGDGGQTHTKENQNDTWWELDLQAEHSIESIVVWNRTEEDLGERLDRFRLTVLDSNRREIFRKDRIPAPRMQVRFDLGSDTAGSLRRAAINAIVTTGRDETKTFELLAKFIREGQDRATAVRAISRLPQNRWPQPQLRPLVESIVQYVGELPASERTAPAVQDALQLGNDLAALLPSRVGQPLRRTLRELGVPVLLLRPIAHQILFDKGHLYVEAGRPVEIVFENLDIMPHNLVITKPGALERVGIEGEKMAADPEAFSKNFVPKIPQILAATRLLQPQQTDRINFTAPTEIGDYPYVCTFPGHWRRMNGIMHVVKNLDDVPRDALLAAATQTQTVTRPFVRSWTVADFSDRLEKLSSGNANAGRELFKTLACVQCHRMKGVGGQVGPDLVAVKEKLDTKKMQTADVLTEMVEPSKVIDNKFRSVVLELADGRVISGIIVGENDQEVRVAANPLDPQASAEPIVLRASEIEERFPSAVSLMPQGLLNTLEEQEIFDLLSYIISGG